MAWVDEGLGGPVRETRSRRRRKVRFARGAVNREFPRGMPASHTGNSDLRPIRDRRYLTTDN